MAKAICSRCGATYHWRGRPLREVPCPRCGGEGRVYRRTRKEER